MKNAQRIVATIMLLSMIYISSTAQIVSDGTLLSKIKNFRREKNFLIENFRCLKVDNVFIVIPDSISHECKTFDGTPIVIDSDIKNIKFGNPCDTNIDTQGFIPWYKRFIDLTYGDLLFDYENSRKVRDRDLRYFDANEPGGELLRVCWETSCYKEIINNRINDLISHQLAGITQEYISGFSKDTVHILTVKNNAHFYNLNLKKGDVIIYTGIIITVISANKDIGKIFGIDAKGPTLAELYIDKGNESITLFGLTNKLYYNRNNIQVHSRSLMVEPASYDLKRIVDNDEKFSVNQIPVTPGSNVNLSYGNLISIKPGTDLQIPGYPQIKRNSWIFFKNNIPVSYEFNSTLKLNQNDFATEGTVIIYLNDANRPNAYHIKPKAIVTFNNLELAADRWQSFDSTFTFGAGFLESDAVIGGVPLAGMKNVVGKSMYDKRYDIPRPTIIRNKQVYAGYLTQNFDYTTKGVTFPLSENKYFQFNGEQVLVVATFYKDFTFNTHLYKKGDFLFHNYKKNATVTVLNTDELKAVGYFFQGALQDETKKELLALSGKGPIAHFGDRDITQNTSFVYLDNGFTWTNHVHVNNFLSQAWPLHDCDCDFDFFLSLKWRNDYKLNQYEFYIPSIWLTNINYNLSFCPLGAGIADFLLHMYYVIAAPFIQLTGDIDLYRLEKAVNLKVKEIEKIYNVNGSLSILRLYIENNELKADLEYSIEVDPIRF